MVRVVFLHPDLGIGGAERLVVDAGLALKSRGHQVTFVTAHHDEKHCFSETKQKTEDGGEPQLKVISAGDYLPRTLCGLCYALCAYVRMIYAAFYIVLLSGLKPEVIICDQISAAIPVFKLFSRKTKIVFYCHFPDQLLTTRETMVKRWYRKPIDWIEEKTTVMADVCLVNSNFTGRHRERLHWFI
jgi:alpha-1,3/alpha-1,6-mannosyltransferase